MNTLRSVLILAAVGTATTALAGPPDPATLAGNLVNQCAGVKENDIVFIQGGLKDQALLENLAAHVSKAGGFPLLSFGSDQLSRKMYEWTPAKYDSRTPTLGVRLAEMCNAMINIDYVENPSLWSDVPPERAAARAKAETAVYDAMLKRNVKTVNLGNGLYPTDANAQRFGMTKDQLAEIFWSGVNTDPSHLQSTGEKMKQILANGKEVTITNPNGTNLTFKIAGRQPFCSDGVISAEDVKKGGPACQVWLPAGEVYISCVPNTCEGTAVIDRFWYQGKEVKGLNLTFKGGKCTAMTAASGFEPFKAYYDAAGGGKELFGYCDFGINPDVQIPAGSNLLAWMPAGMVTIGMGNNAWAGGDNKCNFDFSGHLPGSTVKVDGRPLIENGTLKH